MEDQPEPEGREKAPVLDACPDPSCSVTGPEVYRADAHPIFCGWMMGNLNRCPQHDELLRPDESECPAPDADEDSDDPHNRRGRNA
jgi:hypothetical protein